MKNLQIILSFAVLVTAFLVSSSANATPPRYAGINDVPIGANETQIFLIRTVSDNEGSHFVDNIHRFLITQNIKTGAVEEHWLLDIIRRSDADAEGNWNVDIEAVDEIEMFEIMRQRGAVPISENIELDFRSAEQYPPRTAELYLTDDGLVRDLGNREELVITGEEIGRLIDINIGPTIKLMPDARPRFDPYEYTIDAYSKNLEECVVEDYSGSWQTNQIISLFCENGYDLFVLSYRIYLVVPKNKQ